MKRSLLLALISVLSSSLLLAQSLAPCGTVSERSEWLINFQKNGIDLSQKSVDFRIGVNAHLLGDDQGEVFSYRLLLESMGALERDYENSGIGFVLNLPVDTLRSTEYNNHDDVLSGADMMFANNVEDVLNIYFLENPAGNCGYNLPYAGIAMADQCSGIADRTISHEVGHALSIPHPFLGWEGGQNADGSIPADFTQPAPRRVTYDYTYFQSTLVRDTLIIDTALVELVARTNCYEAADGFCDTGADYIASRWTCNSNGESQQRQIDPDGETFFSDGTLIMGYANDQCQTRFTPEQEAAMVAFAQSERASWVRSIFDSTLVRGTSTITVDQDGYLPEAGTVSFSTVANATHYYIETSERRGFSPILESGVVTGTDFALDEALYEPNKTYYARIHAFNDHSFLAGMSSRMEFQVREGSSSTSAVVKRISVSPNPVEAGSTLQIPYPKEIVAVQWFDVLGRVVATQTDINADQIEVPATLLPGMYNIVLSTQSGNRLTAKIQVLH